MPTLSPLKRPSPSRAQLTVTLTAEETKTAQDKAIQQLAAQVTIEGFRPGKAPADMVRSKIDPQRVLEETVRGVLPTVFEQIIKDNHLKPIIPPKVEVEAEEPLRFTVTVIEKPTVTLKGIDKIKIAKTEPKFDAKDIDRMVEYLLREYRTFKAVERAAKEGDQVTLDFSATDKAGQEIPGTRATGYQVILGSKSLIPGFEEQLADMTIGQEKTFDITFPKEYHAENLKGKPATFRVHVRGIDEVTTPQLTDAFVKEKQLGESVPDLRGRIEQSMRTQEEQADRSRRESQLLDAIVKAANVDIAPELLEQEERMMLEDLQRNLEAQKQTFDQWLKKRGKKAEEIGKEIREEATRRLTLRLALEVLLEEKKIEATPEELNAARADILASVPAEQRKSAAAYYQEGGEGFDELLWRVRVQKVLGQMLEI